MSTSESMDKTAENNVEKGLDMRQELSALSNSVDRKSID